MIRIWTVLALYLTNLPFTDSLFVALLTLPMFAMVVMGLFKIRSRQFQIGDVFWFCLFLYFVLSPLQRIHGERIGGATEITAYAYDTSEFVTAMLVVVLFCLPFLFVSMERTDPPAAKPRSPPFLVLVPLNVLAFIPFVLSEGGLDRLLSSRLEQDPTQMFIGSILFLGLQSITACLVVVRFRVSRRWSAGLFSVALVIGLLALARNPFNAPRFMLLCAWGPVLMALVGGRIPVAWFYCACLLALTVVFPVLSITTRSGLDGLAELSRISVVDNFFDVPSVDVYDTAVHAVRFMTTHDHMWGEKLLAIVLFFVPRALWPGKPVVGGLDIGNELFAAGMYGTPNLSFFVGCDLYMDFGLVGVMLGGVIAAALLRVALKVDWGVFDGLRVSHLVIVSSLPILLRGPVGAVLPLFVCQVIAIVALSLRSRRRAAHLSSGVGVA
jgi:hypothetical protein